jgi:hypothetical protein
MEHEQLIERLEAIQRKIRLEYYVDAENMIIALVFSLKRVQGDKNE